MIVITIKELKVIVIVFVNLTTEWTGEIANVLKIYVSFSGLWVKQLQTLKADCLNKKEFAHLIIIQSWKDMKM